jgi:hypothetical protein
MQCALQIHPWNGDIEDFDPMLQGFSKKNDQTTFRLKLVSKNANVPFRINHGDRNG